MSKKLIGFIIVIIAILAGIVFFVGGQLASNDVSIEGVSVEYMNYITPSMKQRQEGYDKCMAGKVSFVVVPNNDVINIRNMWLGDIELTYANGEVDRIDKGFLKYNYKKTIRTDINMLEYNEKLKVGYEPAFTYTYEKPYDDGKASDYHLTHFKAKLMVKLRAEGIKEIGFIDADITN